jgi:hypothetical protein
MGVAQLVSWSLTNGGGDGWRMGRGECCISRKTKAKIDCAVVVSDGGSVCDAGAIESSTTIVWILGDMGVVT